MCTASFLKFWSKNILDCQNVFWIILLNFFPSGDTALVTHALYINQSLCGEKLNVSLIILSLAIFKQNIYAYSVREGLNIIVEFEIYGFLYCWV